MPAAALERGAPLLFGLRFPRPRVDSLIRAIARWVGRLAASTENAPARLCGRPRWPSKCRRLVVGLLMHERYPNLPTFVPGRDCHGGLRIDERLPIAIASRRL
jgi:hypothetical protein